MALKAKPAAGRTQEPAPAGFWPAVCVDVYGLAQVPTEWGPKDKLSLTFQLGSEAGRVERDWEGEKKDYPYFAYYTQNLSMGEKANLRAFIEMWRGKPFATDQEADEFDFQKLVGQQCMIQIQHRPKKSGPGVYANITTIVQAPAGQKVEVEDYTPMSQRSKEEMPQWLAGNVFFDVTDTLDPLNPFTQTPYTGDEVGESEPPRDPDLPF